MVSLSTVLPIRETHEFCQATIVRNDEKEIILKNNEKEIVSRNGVKKEIVPRNNVKKELLQGMM